MARKYKFLVQKADRKAADCLLACEIAEENDPKFIVHDDSNRSYVIFDSFDEFKQWFAQPDAPKTLHEVILGSRPQKLKFDIDAAADKVNKLPEIAEPDAPKKPELILDDDEDFAEMWREEYAKDMIKYNTALVVYNELLAKYNAKTPYERRCAWLSAVIRNAIDAAFLRCYDTKLEASDKIITDSTDHTKFSRHFIINNFHVASNREADWFCNYFIAELPAEVKALNVVDSGVYKSKQNFRIVGCHKHDSPTRTKKLITKHTFEDCFISIIGNNSILLPSYDQVDEETDAPEIIDVDDAAILKIAEPYAVGFKFRERVNNHFIYDRTGPSPKCIICDKVHDRDNTLLVRLSHNVVRLSCRLAMRFTNTNKSIVIGKIKGGNAKPTPQQINIAEMVEQVKSKKSELDVIPPEFSITRYNSKNVQPYTFVDGLYDGLIVKSLMGTSKSKEERNFISKLYEYVRVIIVSFRRSFTSEVRGLLPDFVDYQAVKGPLKQKRLIVQVDSLYRVEIDPKEQTLLVLDESESILTQFENKSMRDRNTLEPGWAKFEWLMYNATQVIAMDAFAGERTYNLMRFTRKNVCMVENTYCPPPELAPIDTYYNTDKELFALIFEAAKNAQREPFVIISNSIANAKFALDGCRDANPYAKIKMYSGDSTAEERQDLNDVNTNWKDVDILIYTSTISAGCSFERERFHRVYAYFTSKSTDYKTSIQMLGRVRNVKTREYHICINHTDAEIPSSIPEIEQTIRTVDGCCEFRRKNGIDINTNMPRFLNAAGEVDIRVKDLYYWVHIYNIRARALSVNDFFNKFIDLRIRSGATVNGYRGIVAGDLKNIAKKKAECINRIKDEKTDAIVNAELLDCDEVKQLEQKEYLTADEAASLSLHNLSTFYNVPVNVINKEFVKKFNTPKARRIFKNLNRTTFGQSINGGVNSYAAYLAGQPKTKTATGQDRELCKLMITVDIINILCGEMCADINRFVKLTFARIWVETKLSELMAYIKTHEVAISSLFEIKKSRLAGILERDLRGQMDVVNGLLDSMFGVKLKLKGKDSDMFHIEPPKDFIYNEQTKRYDVVLPKPAPEPEPEQPCKLLQTCDDIYPNNPNEIALQQCTVSYFDKNNYGGVGLIDSAEDDKNIICRILIRKMGYSCGDPEFKYYSETITIRRGAVITRTICKYRCTDCVDQLKPHGYMNGLLDMPGNIVDYIANKHNIKITEEHIEQQ